MYPDKRSVRGGCPMNYLCKFWKIGEDGRTKELVYEGTFDSKELTADDIAAEAGGSIAEAVETNG